MDNSVELWFTAAESKIIVKALTLYLGMLGLQPNEQLQEQVADIIIDINRRLHDD